ncbi:NADH dehydrogenase [ubiquinone] 1 alpha subcomplex subunit 12 [Elysia marginata]|uniref:NADH dehydrogenase [ubiquinone] 1 alpha subcomplex subunit 12 n=1 Tax=Elysia marginata TaxID=1093978 RepID=A0AAV4GXJ2_9GAST|nr:NADH dehydrogenase [ubiquinone] 1 alpha subcomplex subunit 12 [Elysia marginata]
MSLFQKIGNIGKIIKQNNGLVGTYLKLFRMDDFKWGTMVGEDKYGNKYYQNDYYFFGTDGFSTLPTNRLPSFPFLDASGCQTMLRTYQEQTGVMSLTAPQGRRLRRGFHPKIIHENKPPVI